jgi:hypothetical protein
VHGLEEFALKRAAIALFSNKEAWRWMSCYLKVALASWDSERYGTDGGKVDGSTY